MQTEAEKHAAKRVAAAVKSVAAQWGTGWNRLGTSVREALVRAEVLAEISRLPVHQIEPAQYHQMVDRLAVAAMQWSGDL
jgi:hypothetical protein